jgi:hypothetical protein
MRREERDDQEERARRIAIVQEIDRPADGPLRGVQGVGQMPGAGGPVVVHHAAAVEAPGRVGGLTLEPAIVVAVGRVVVVQEHLTEAVAPAARVQMHASPDEGGLIAGRLQHAGERGRGIPIDVVLIPDEPMRGRVLAGQERAACGDAGGAGGVGPPEACAGSGDGVEIGGEQHGVAFDGEAVAPLLVGHDEQDVGSRVGRHRGGKLPRRAQLELRKFARATPVQCPGRSGVVRAGVRNAQQRRMRWRRSFDHDPNNRYDGNQTRQIRKRCVQRCLRLHLRRFSFLTPPKVKLRNEPNHKNPPFPSGATVGAWANAIACRMGCYVIAGQRSCSLT